jgi:hypothetical protein
MFIASDITFRALHTTRLRLSSLPIEAFTLERQVAFCFPLADSSKIKLNILPGSVNIKNSLEFDYWEVDPAWDGTIFRSAAQAQRPVRSGELAHEIKIKTGRNMCIRLVTVKGELLQRELYV